MAQTLADLRPTLNSAPLTIAIEGFSSARLLVEHHRHARHQAHINLLRVWQVPGRARYTISGAA